MLSRRTALQAGLAAFAAGVHVSAAETPARNNRIKQSLCRWCFGKIPLEKLAAEVKPLGYASIELLAAKEVLTVKPLGLTCAVLGASGPIKIESCLNRTENHAAVVAELTKNIDFAAENGVPSVICFSGNRKGMDDAEGLKNCAAGLKQVVGHAETKGVTIVMELLNSKVNHKDYMCDRTHWGVELVKAVGSPRFKLLYDIYHMQVQEGDVIATIKKSHESIAHYHTAGVPGRNEIDETQELFYPAVIKAILATGYTGYLGQEFIPKRDPIAGLKQAFTICDV